MKISCQWLSFEAGKTLSANDPFETMNSVTVTDVTRGKTDIDYVFSIDIEDLFYSVLRNELLVAVVNCIATNGEIAFQNAAGISVNNFRSLLEFLPQCHPNIFRK